MTEEITKAYDALRRGEIVLLFDADGREEETDMVVASEFVDHNTIRMMRKDAGGLVCTTVPPDARRVLGIPYLVDILDGSSDRFPVIGGLRPDDIPYDAKSSFSLTINHRRTFTGITDRDRALTIREFAKVVRSAISSGDGYAAQELARSFRSPGHVHLLNASDGLVLERQGHTELSTVLVMLAGLTPTATICEMMGEDGNALPKESARKYAAERGLVYLEGDEIVSIWKRSMGQK